jgi:glycosyltransferase involved in cell wall biosynthesis
MQLIIEKDLVADLIDTQEQSRDNDQTQRGPPKKSILENAMLHGQRVVVVMPAYNAALTLERTFGQIPRDCVDEVVLVDDASADETVQIARGLGIQHVLVHSQNRGYGANQKTCYSAALAQDADIVVMLHPDYQYEPRLITAMAGMIGSGVYDLVLGSRILGDQARGALKGGMPLYKYIANRALTAFQNAFLGTKLSEYHTGYRAFSRQALLSLPLLKNSDDFIFDNQLLVQAIALKLRIGEISCPTRYSPESSSISATNSLIYGVGVIATTLQYRLWRWGLAKPRFLAFGANDSFLQPQKPNADLSRSQG